MLRKQGSIELVKRYTVQVFSQQSGKVEKRGFTPIATYDKYREHNYLVGFGHSSRANNFNAIKTNINNYDYVAIDWIIAVDVKLVEPDASVAYEINKLELVDKYVRLLDGNSVKMSGLFINNGIKGHYPIDKNDGWYKIFADIIYNQMVIFNY